MWNKCIFLNIRHIGERIIRGCASAVLRDCNMIELVHAKFTHTYAATRRPSGMHVGRASVSLSVFSDLFEPPEEGKGIGFPRKIAQPELTNNVDDQFWLEFSTTFQHPNFYYSVISIFDGRQRSVYIDFTIENNMTIEALISSHIDKNSRLYFQCVHHRLVPRKCHQRHWQNSKLNSWYWQLVNIPASGMVFSFFELFWFLYQGHTFTKNRPNTRHRHQIRFIPLNFHKFAAWVGLIPTQIRHVIILAADKIADSPIK